MSTAVSPRPFETTSDIGPIVVMGVCGCGKTSVGERLTSTLGCRFIGGDRRHPVVNVLKMRQGIPLEDADRWPWPEVHGTELGKDEETIVSCSALKRSYRDLLRIRAGRPLHAAVVARQPVGNA